MIEFIKGLIEKGFAYEASGDVYFKVASHDSYGQLKKQSIEQLKDGVARVEENDKKEDQLDFALWKAFPDEPDTSFESPWGIGRPGWHLECSTMIKSILESKFNITTLDIHSGGDDLIFPHHENECAQSECLTGEPLAKYWMHNGMVMVNGTKMSKSLNNFMTIKGALEKFKPNTIRYFCFATHYKRQINFTDEALQSAENGFNKLYNQIKDRVKQLNSEKLELKLDQNLIDEFNKHMDNDLSSPQALAILFENINDDTKHDTIIHLLNILGFDLVNVEAANQTNHKALDQLVRTLIDMRNEARASKDFATSDKIRDDLASAGIIVKDFRDKPSEWSFSS